MSEQREWCISRAISYLFITFAGMTDQKITREEMNTIVQLVREWLPNEPGEVLIENIKLTHGWVMEDVSNGTFLEQFTIIASYLESMFDAKKKKYFLNDLVRIAVADGNFSDAERGIIKDMATSWGMENYKI